jgi:hypothetical protein
MCNLTTFLFGVGGLVLLLLVLLPSGFCWDSSGPMEKEAVDIGIGWLDLI